MIRQIIPVFFTTDIPRTLAFYTETLGFEQVGLWGDPVSYGIVAREGHAIHFRCAAPPAQQPEKYNEELLDAYLFVDDADRLHAELTGKGIEIARPLGDMPWGCREFVAKDCDGRLLAFGENLNARGSKSVKGKDLPAAVPELPVSSVDGAVAYFRDKLGFTHDFGDEAGGIAGISRGACRLFLTNQSFREPMNNASPVAIWINLNSKAEVDELYAEWNPAGAKIVSPPEDKPWKLREFTALDPDGNQLRVFCDFRHEGAA